MRNIYLLPTDKPSSLYYKDDNYKLANSTISIDWYISSAGYKPTNIYITNDEKIKEGDYVIEDIGGVVYGPIDRDSIVENPKKIILTSDQELTEHGIQSIDDEFLEWFVNNPNCEYVEVELLQAYKLDRELGDFMYKTVFPQKEQDYEIVSIGEERIKLYIQEQNIDNTMKNNDTLEFGLMEIELKNTKRILASLEKALEDRDKQIAEMYSKEEVYKILVEHTIELFKKEPCTLDEWFEKYKKK
jgi:hypothetical protein